MSCTLNYIPDYLQTKDKPTVDVFSIGEELYYRCKGDVCSKPYDNISLFDISHNRNFCNPRVYKREDVLFNIKPGDPEEKYDLNIITLSIVNLNEGSTYSKEIISGNDPNLRVLIRLIHDPLPCMYPHSVFEISINNVVINSDNYQTILNKKNITFKNLRTDIRQEITSMIQTGNIDDSIQVEIITEP